MAPILTTGAGKYGGVAAPAYVGPGNVTGWSSAYGYWGLRAYTAAQIGQPLIKISDQAQAHQITVNSAANGYVDIAAIAAWVTTWSVTTIGVDQIYDQIGTQHLLPLYPAFPNELTLNIVGGLPAFKGDPTGRAQISAAVAVAQAQPATVAAIARFNTYTANGALFSGGAGNFAPFVNGGVASINQYFGGTVTAFTNVADNTFASLISVANGASSTFSSNGTIVTAGTNPGSNGIATTNKVTMLAGTDGGATSLNGYLFEILVKAGAVSTTNQGLMTANQRAIGTGF